MKFSIIIPIYNSEKYLRDSLNSVLSQTFKDYECILVDDGSKDSSPSICDEYASKYNNFKVFHNENQGQLLSRQFGVNHSIGDFLLFLDSDDVLNENTLLLLDHYLSAYDCDMVIYPLTRFSGDVPYSQEVAKAPLNIVDDQNELCSIFLTSQSYNSMCNKAVKRSLFKDVDFQEFKKVRNGEDFLQTISLVQENPKTIFVDNKFYYYRYNPTSVTATVDLDTIVNDAIIVGDYYILIIDKYNLKSNMDFYTFRTYHVDIFISTLLKIVLNAKNNNERKKYFKIIKESNYYKNFLSNGPIYNKKLKKRKIIWFLYKHSLYTLLIWITLFILKK